MSIADNGKFEQKEMQKIKPVKYNWYDWLINYIPKPTRKSGFKDKTIILFKTNTHKQTAYGRTKKLRELKKRKKISNLFILKIKKIKDRIIKNTRTLFE